MKSLENTCHTSAVVIRYEEALYQVYAPLPLPFTYIAKILLLTLLVSVLQATFFRATPCQAGSLEKNHLVFVGTKTYIPDALLVAKPETLKK